jgi:membrane protease YdiL (CAAX protease family)
MLFHRSLWVAVLAHGFFDATSFALLALVERLGILEKLKGM